MNPDQKISLLIAEDSLILQDKLKALISFESDFELFAVVGSGRDAVQSVRDGGAEHPDVALLDIEMETPFAGIDAAGKLKELHPDIKIIMLTVLESEEAITAAFEAGADDYVLKSSGSMEILFSIRAAYKGDSSIKPRIARTLKKEIIRIRKTKDHLRFILTIVSQITPTEIMILEELLEGRKQADIARNLCIELSTVKTHINRILKKFKMRRSSEMVQFIGETCLLDFLKDQSSSV